MWFAWPIQSLLHHLQEQDVCPVNRPYQNRKHHTHFLAFLEHFIKRHLPEFNHSFQISFKKNNNAGFFVLFIFQLIYLKLFQLFISWGLNSSVLFCFSPTFSIKYLGNSKHKTNPLKLGSIHQEVSQQFCFLFERKSQEINKPSGKPVFTQELLNRKVINVSHNYRQP